jgi:hypothetical protein
MAERENEQQYARPELERFGTHSSRAGTPFRRPSRRRGGHSIEQDSPVDAARGRVTSPIELPKKRFSDPVLRVYSEGTEIPDEFPSATDLRRAGYSTYHSVFNMTPDEAAALEPTISADVVRAIAELRSHT